MNPLLNLLPGIFDTAGKVIDQFVEDKDLALKIKAQIQAETLSVAREELKSGTAVVTQEAKGESWLQRNWRPITMLTFVGLIVAKWLGWTAPGITPELELALLEIIKIGLGGYVVGRSVEKGIKEWKK